MKFLWLKRLGLSAIGGSVMTLLGLTWIIDSAASIDKISFVAELDTLSKYDGFLFLVGTMLICSLGVVYFSLWWFDVGEKQDPST